VATADRNHIIRKCGRRVRAADIRMGRAERHCSDTAGFKSMMISEHASRSLGQYPEDGVDPWSGRRVADEENQVCHHGAPAPAPEYPAKASQSGLAGCSGYRGVVLPGIARRVSAGIGHPRALRPARDTRYHETKWLRESSRIRGEDTGTRERLVHEGRFWRVRGYPRRSRRRRGDEQHKLEDFSPWGVPPEIAVTGG